MLLNTRTSLAVRPWQGSQKQRGLSEAQPSFWGDMSLVIILEWSATGAVTDRQLVFSFWGWGGGRSMLSWTPSG